MAIWRGPATLASAVRSRPTASHATRQTFRRRCSRLQRFAVTRMSHHLSSCRVAAAGAFSDGNKHLLQVAGNAHRPGEPRELRRDQLFQHVALRLDHCLAPFVRKAQPTADDDL